MAEDIKLLRKRLCGSLSDIHVYFGVKESRNSVGLSALVNLSFDPAGTSFQHCDPEEERPYFHFKNFPGSRLYQLVSNPGVVAVSLYDERNFLTKLNQVTVDHKGNVIRGYHQIIPCNGVVINLDLDLLKSSTDS
jgi:hypothetical protein